MRCILCIILIFFIVGYACAQDSSKNTLGKSILFDRPKGDTVKKIKVDTIAAAPALKDTTAKPKHDPHKATLRSLILPGWGQAYNKEYWKIPLVYAAVGIPIGTYFYNNTWYKRTRDAYVIVVNGDVAHYKDINEKLFYNGAPLDAGSLQNYRNEFRRDRDYSILVTLFAWALNVVDATVFGHLKNFDVSDDLSMKIQPGFDPVLKTTNVGLVLDFKKRQHKVSDPSR